MNYSKIQISRIGTRFWRRGFKIRMPKAVPLLWGVGNLSPEILEIEVLGNEISCILMPSQWLKCLSFL